jgi:hypothetical protein
MRDGLMSRINGTDREKMHGMQEKAKQVKTKLSYAIIAI